MAWRSPGGPQSTSCPALVRGSDITEGSGSGDENLENSDRAGSVTPAVSSCFSTFQSSSREDRWRIVLIREPMRRKVLLNDSNEILDRNVRGFMEPSHLASLCGAFLMARVHVTGPSASLGSP